MKPGRCGTILTVLLIGCSEATNPSRPEIGTLPKTASTESIELRLELDPASAKTHGREPQFTATIINHGEKTLHLIHPGDGSEAGWRTPRTRWLVSPVLDPETGARLPPLPQTSAPRCGNVNPVTTDEVFDLAAGSSCQLDSWFLWPQFPGPGTYLVALEYVNDPSMKPRGLALGEHSQEALRAIAGSTPCTVISNEVPYTVR